MTNKTFVRGALMSVAVAAVAASLLTVSGAIDVPQPSRDTPSGKLAVACAVPYDKFVYAELHNVLVKQATALNRLGLGETKADVCAEVSKVAAGKADPKVDFVEYGNAVYHARAVLGAAVLYRASQGATMDKATLHDMGMAFDATDKTMARWVPGKATPKLIKEEGVAFVRNNLGLGGRGDIDSTALKDRKFASYVYNLDISP